MRIGLVIYGNLDQVSGGYLYDRKLVEHLRDRGDEVLLFSQPKRPYPLQPLANANLSFWNRLRSADLDVLLQDELNHAALAVGNHWLRQRIDAPIVAIVHHLRAAENRSVVSATLSRELERLYLGGTDARIYNSPSTKEAVEALAGPRPHVVARPSGRRFGASASPDAVTQRAMEEDPLRLLFVGNLIPRKRLHLLIDGLRRVPSTAWTLDVVGDPSADDTYAATVRQRLRRLDDPFRVTLHGQVSDDALKTLLDDAHVLAVPSAHEGYGIVYVEAMGRGLPVLAGPSGGVRDVVGDPSAHDTYMATVRRRVRQFDDPSCVTLHGQVTDDALKALLDGSHVLAVPSAHEGYGIVYVEAMGRGLPVLAGPSGGVQDVVAAGETGYFVETAADIAEAIGTWADDRDHLAEMGRAAVAAYRATPTWPETCRRIASFLDRLARRSSSQRHPLS